MSETAAIRIPRTPGLSGIELEGGGTHTTTTTAAAWQPCIATDQAGQGLR